MRNIATAQSFNSCYQDEVTRLAPLVQGTDDPVAAREFVGDALLKSAFLAILSHAQLVGFNPLDASLCELQAWLAKGAEQELPKGLLRPLPWLRVRDDDWAIAMACLGAFEYRLGDGEPRAITPEALGYAIERFIDQKRLGAYYTDPQFARRIVREAVRIGLAHRMEWELDAEGVPHLVERLGPGGMEELVQVVLPSFRCLDPACGSGAFLLAVADEIEEIREAVRHRGRDMSLAGYKDGSRFEDAWRTLSENVYGAELVEGGAEVARMRLYLHLAQKAETDEERQRLPNLRLRVLCGNSLVGIMPEHRRDQHGIFTPTLRDLLKRRDDLFYRIAAGEEAPEAMDLLDRMNGYLLDDLLLDEFSMCRARVCRPNIAPDGKEKGWAQRTVRGTDVERIRPIHWGYACQDVFRDGGFDVIATNPPWDSFRANKKEWFTTVAPGIQLNAMSNPDFAKRSRELLQDPTVRKAWADHAERYAHVATYFHNAPHFAEPPDELEEASGSLNLFHLFTRLSLRLLREGGYCGIIIPSGVLTDVGCRGLRREFFNGCRLGWSFTQHNNGVFDGVCDRFRFTILGLQKGGTTGPFRCYYGEGGVRELDAFLADRHGTNGYRLERDLVHQLYPETLSVPLAHTQAEVGILRRLATLPACGVFERDRRARTETDWEATPLFLGLEEEPTKGDDA